MASVRHKKPVLTFKDEQSAKRRRRKTARAIFIAASLILGLSLLLFLLFFAGIFDVRRLKIDSPDTIPRDAVQSYVEDWLGRSYLGIKARSNPFIFNAESIGPGLSEKFTRIKQVKIDISTLHELRINIDERKSLGVWCRGATECYYFDETGVAFAPTNPSSGSLFAVIEDQTQRPVKMGAQVCSSSLLNNVEKIRRLLQFADLAYDKFIIPADVTGGIYVQMNEGWTLKLNDKVNISEQIQSMLKLFHDKLPFSERVKLKYVDLQIQDRIYYQ